MSHIPGIIIIGTIVHCPKPFELEIITDGFIIANAIDGMILALGDSRQLTSAEQTLNIKRDTVITLTATQLLIPGLIDTHIHAPQYPNAGLGYDKTLLDWLDSYTYKLEKLYADDALSTKVYSAVVRKTLNYGTTTACYFASMFKRSSLILVDRVIEHGQRAFVGKINMTRLAPSDYVETAEQSIRDTLEFIGEVQDKKNELVQPIITPRFALSVDMEFMTKLGDLAKTQNLNIQTHIAENKDELSMVDRFYNDSYANVYNQANLLTPKTILAHGIYLSDAELKLIQQNGTSIAHCPESNNNLRSGVCDVRKLIQNGINVGLGTDVAGGGAPSIINAMRLAMDASIHLSFNRPDYTPLTYTDVFYLATLGGANALALGNKIGNFQVGKYFDAIIIDLDVNQSSADLLLSCDPRELLQKFIYLGDDRNVVKVFVAGRLVKDVSE